MLDVSGKIERCSPAAFAAPVAAAIEGWRMLRNYSVLPDAGGWLDQSAAFLDAVRIADAEVASWQTTSQPNS